MSNKSKNSLGRSLVKSRFGGNNKKGKESFRHTSDLDDGYDWGRLNLRSVTEQSSLDDFLSTAQLAGTEFEAEKLNVKIVTAEKQLIADRERSIKQKQEENKKLLRIPRRPQWDDNTTADELHKKERDGFLEWRRQLVQLESVEGISLTPFEKNIEFWRQLWRVIEKSDIVCQIVDARNPLLFHCEDINTYVKEVNKNKVNMVLLNKADLLTTKQREQWVQYFNSIGLRVAFWSAADILRQQKEGNKKEKQEQQSESSDEDSEESDTTEDDDAMDDDDERGKSNESEESSGMDEKPAVSDSVPQAAVMDTANEQSDDVQKSVQNDHSVETEHTSSTTPDDGDMRSDNVTNILNSAALLTRDELLQFWRSLKAADTNGVVTVGLVGYPNVGKSSTINALMQSKKVAVSETPGRTKHFQTLYVDESLMLCDCPGLVMPSFVSSPAELTVNSILPIDQMRDCFPPITLVCNRIPRPVLEYCYGVTLPPPGEGEEPSRPPTAVELLTAYARMRSFMTHKGIPDFQRSSRQILKDFVKGKLLFCHPPPLPGVSEISFNEESHSLLMKRAVEQPAAAKPTSTVDMEFFNKSNQQASSRGVLGVQGFTRKTDFVRPHTSGDQQVSSKKHHNRKKKEKLRRIYGHLDA